MGGGVTRQVSIAGEAQDVSTHWKSGQQLPSELRGGEAEKETGVRLQELGLPGPREAGMAQRLLELLLLLQLCQGAVDSVRNLKLRANEQQLLGGNARASLLEEKKVGGEWVHHQGVGAWRTGAQQAPGILASQGEEDGGIFPLQNLRDA